MSAFYFLVAASDLTTGDPATEFAGETLQTNARPGATIPVSHGAGKCGSYASDGLGTYSNSANFPAATTYGTSVVIVNAGDAGKDRIRTIWVPNSKPSPQVKLTSITLYKEASYDSGQCAEDAPLSNTQYYKYVATA